MPRVVTVCVAASLLSLTLASPATGQVRTHPRDPVPAVSVTCFHGPHLGYRVWLELRQPAEVQTGRADGTVRDYGVLYTGESSYWFSELDVSSAVSLDVRWTDATGYVWDDAFDIRRYAVCHDYPAHV